MNRADFTQFKINKMTNYQNDIMDLLEGATPKQKYDYLKSLLKLIEGKRFLFKVEYHSLWGLPVSMSAGIAAYDQKEALHIFWEGKNKEQFEVTSCIKIDTLIA